MTRARRVLREADQLDFWPELRSRSMSFYAACAAARAPARSVSEDGRASGGTAGGEAPLGIYGENAVTLPPSKGVKQ